MTLSPADKVDIIERLALHGHLVDAQCPERFGEVFADDLVVDVSELGLSPLPIKDHERPLNDYIAASRERPPTQLAMHVTNVVVGECHATVHAWSKGLVIGADGVTSFTYFDALTRTPDGWRVRRRQISPRITPGGGREPGRCDC